jgi:hypothetical protein
MDEAPLLARAHVRSLSQAERRAYREEQRSSSAGTARCKAATTVGPPLPRVPRGDASAGLPRLGLVIPPSTESFLVDTRFVVALWGELRDLGPALGSASCPGSAPTLLRNAKTREKSRIAGEEGGGGGDEGGGGGGAVYPEESINLTSRIIQQVRSAWS